MTEIAIFVSIFIILVLLVVILYLSLIFSDLKAHVDQIEKEQKLVSNYTYLEKSWCQGILDVIKNRYNVGTVDGKWTCQYGPEVYHVWRAMLGKFSAEQAHLIINLLIYLKMASDSQNNKMFDGDGRFTIKNSMN